MLCHFYTTFLPTRPRRDSKVNDQVTLTTSHLQMTFFRQIAKTTLVILCIIWYLVTSPESNSCVVTLRLRITRCHVHKTTEDRQITTLKFHLKTYSFVYFILIVSIFVMYNMKFYNTAVPSFHGHCQTVLARYTVCQFN